MSETNTSQFRITNDHFLQTLDPQKFKQSLEDNYERAMLTRLVSRNGNKRASSLYAERRLATDVSSIAGIESELLTTHRTQKTGQQGIEQNNNEIATLRREGRQICHLSSELADDALKNKRQLVKKLDKLEKRGHEDYKAIDNPHLGKQDTGSREFVEMVNRTNFKKMIVNKMLVQIVNKSDVLKEFQQHEAKTLMASKLSKSFPKGSEISSGNPVIKEAVPEAEAEEDLKEKEACMEYELKLGGPPSMDVGKPGARKLRGAHETKFANDTGLQKRNKNFELAIVEEDGEL